MLILGGEPPFDAVKEPRFGEVIAKLNEWILINDGASGNSASGIREKIAELNTVINAFTTDMTARVTAHINLVGAVHGENKASIGLSKKDNFRVATVAEQIALANVQAFVTPFGAKQAVDNSNKNFDKSQYQLNDVFQVSSFYYPNDFQTKTPVGVQPTRYFKTGEWSKVLIDKDRLVYQPNHDTSQYNVGSLFLSMGTKTLGRTKLMEIINIETPFNGVGWNQTSSDMGDGKVSFFKSLSDRSIYHYKTSLTLPAGNRAYVMSTKFNTQQFKGLGVSVRMANANTLSIAHQFFYVANPGTDPTLTLAVNAGYLGQFELLGKAIYAGAANSVHSFLLTDFVNVPAGTVLTVPDEQGTGPVVSLFWNVIDREAYLHINLVVRASLAGSTRDFTLSLTESIQPGTLVTGGSAIFKQLGTLTKDTLDTNLDLVTGAKWLKVTDVFDMADLSQMPGVVLNSGEVIKAATTKYGIRTKRCSTDFAGLSTFITSNRPVLDIKFATTEVSAPSRHDSMGIIPERIIPVAATSVLDYLVYSLDSSTGRYEWRDLHWGSTTLDGVVTSDGQFGIAPPDSMKENKNLKDFPTCLMVIANKNTMGVSLDGMCFTTSNDYQGKTGVGYNPDTQTLTPGTPVSLLKTNLDSLTGLRVGVMGRAKALYPGVADVLKSPQIHIYCVTTNRALVVITDGVNYAEAGVSYYTVTNNTLSLTNVASGTLGLTRVTPANTPVPTGVSRESRSGDGTWMKYSDLHVSRDTAENMTFVMTRPFGDVYGDLSFSVTAFGTAPVFTPRAINVARFYNNKKQIDLVDELYPSLLIPNKGVYQYDSANTVFSTVLKDVGGSTYTDPYEVNEVGWVYLPAGSRLTLNGRTYIMDKDYPIFVGATGVRYCYLTRQVGGVTVLASDVKREPANHEVWFGTATNGILVLNRDYLVLDNHQVTGVRQGSAIPVFADDGGRGTNKFFTLRDLK